MGAVVDWAMMGVFCNAGQVCCSTSRLLVQKNIAQKLSERLLAKAGTLKVGDPLDKDTQMGPLVSAVQRDKVVGFLERAEAEGLDVKRARLDVAEPLKSGYYLPPPILNNVPVGSEAWKKEIFGPVLSMRTFETEEEAVKLANDTTYGLGNAVYSKDEARCARVASKLKSGIVWQNCNQVVFAGTPFGGRLGKASGFGREGGVSGLMEYVHEKTVVKSIKVGYSQGAYA